MASPPPWRIDGGHGVFHDFFRLRGGCIRGCILPTGRGLPALWERDGDMAVVRHRTFP